MKEKGIAFDTGNKRKTMILLFPKINASNKMGMDGLCCKSVSVTI